MHLRIEGEIGHGDHSGAPFISECLDDSFLGLRSFSSFPLVIHRQWNQFITSFVAFPAAHRVVKCEKLYKIGKTESGETKIG